MKARDYGVVYVTPVADARLQSGKACFIVEWYDESRPIDIVAGHLTVGGWRGQVFHTDRDVGAELAAKLGRKVEGTRGKVGV